MTNLSVVIPVYNECQRIESTLRTVSEYLKVHHPEHEIIAVDDGSSDGTGVILQELTTRIGGLRAIRYTPNRGKGAALRRGFEAATGEWVAIVDADLELPIDLLQTFFEVQRSSGARIVVGSKRHPESVIDRPRVRRWLSRGYNLLVTTAFRLPVNDTQVGFKIFHRDTITGVTRCALVKRYAMDVELLIVQHLLGFSMAEAPVRIGTARPGAGRFRVGTILDIFRETVGIWYRLYITGFYHRALASQGIALPRARALFPAPDVESDA